MEEYIEVKICFHCDYCLEEFVLKEYLTEHEPNHTGERLFVFSYCEKIFTLKL